jgi:hypothetical protein
VVSTTFPHIASQNIKESEVKFKAKRVKFKATTSLKAQSSKLKEAAFSENFLQASFSIHIFLKCLWNQH